MTFSSQNIIVRFKISRLLYFSGSGHHVNFPDIVLRGGMYSDDGNVGYILEVLISTGDVVKSGEQWWQMPQGCRWQSSY